MAGVSQAGARRKYSWWWDSHISPKNSKWLQENLTDMDSKVKQMIKLIEEDADSFARRAEMYYKKRPELMKMVEEFYRAYRSLAERYDHATGVIRQAQRTMAEAFPNQVPFMLSDESPGFASEVDPHTPEVPHPGRAAFDLERNGGFGDDSDPVTRKGPKQFGDVFGSGERFADGKARKVLNFQAAGEERDRGSQHNGTRSSDRMGKAEAEILNLKNALAKLESEKEAGLLQYEQSLERLSNLESEVSRAQNNSQELNKRASKAEAEVRNLNGALGKLEAERDANLVQYQQYLEKISNLENSVTSSQKTAGELNERALKAETEAEVLKQDLSRIMAERDTVLGQYKQSVEMISKMQSKLVQTEEEARIINERVDKADCEVENLKQSFAKLAEEKETTIAQYLRCLETISTLEMKLARAYEEVERLSSEVSNGVAKLKGAEERCVALESSNRTLQLELESLVHKVGSQGDELTEKQKELGRLWTCVQEERLRFVEAETAFQTLQHLHSQSQEELRSMVSELQIKAENLNEMKNRSRGLELEVEKVKEENKSLNEVNLSSAVSIKNLQEDILSLRETIKRLEEEVELRVNQRNALQQEIYCLKEELNELSKKHGIMLEKVESLGYDPEGFGSSVKDLQDENVKLMQSCKANQVEKLALLEQLKIMVKLMEKNTMLENSLADLNDELEGVREKVKVLEESCQSLLEEKSNLVEEKTEVFSQLRVTNETLEKLSEINSDLESSLSEANTELEGLRVKSKSLEDSCLLIDREKSCLVTEKEDLVSQLDHTRKILDDLGNRYAALEERLSVLQNDRENVIGIAEELRVQLDAEKTQHANFCEASEAQLASRELQISRLQEGILCGKKEYEAEQDKALGAEIEILILLKFIQGLEEKHLGLLVERQKLLEASVKSKNLISEIQHENAGQKVENRSLSEHNSILRIGLSRLMKILDINGYDGCDDCANQDQGLLNRVIAKVQETQDSLFTSFDEYQRVVTEKSVLVAILEQLESDGSNLMEDRNRIERDCTIKSEELSAIQVVRQELFLSNEELKLKISEGDHRELALASKTEDLERQLVSLQTAYGILQKENVDSHEEKKSLTLKVSDLEEQRSCLEEEIHAMLGKTVFHSNLSLVFHDVISKNLVDLADLAEKLNKLDSDNVYLDDKARVLEEELEGARKENLHLKEILAQSDCELLVAKSFNGRLQNEIVDTKDVLLRKENEIEQLEDQADAFFADLQILKVHEVLLEGKVNEIVEACVSLEDESNSKSVEIELLKRKFGDTNGELQAQVASYASAVVSLKSCIASLEKHTMTDELCNKHINQVPEDVCLVAQNDEVYKTDEAQTTIQLDGISELEDLKRRIEAIEIALTENEKAAKLENMAAGLKLDTAVKEIEELKARGSSKWENGQSSKVFAASEGQEEQRNEPNMNLRVRTRRNKTQDIIELDNEVLTKDIVLDQISSDCSSYGRSKRQTVDGNSHLLELWETVDHDGSIDLTVGKARKSKNPSVESLMEKELGVDKLEISRRLSSSSRKEGSKRRVLERLDSDAQKLSNLQITVQDLKRKVVEVTENSKKGKTMKYDTVKGQLDEAEEAITKLFDSNRKLAKNFEDGSQSSSDGIPAATSTLNESGSVRRRRVSEQARRGSEKIGRLQMEVQRLQFLLLKLDSDEKESSRARIRVPDPKSRVLLRDYLYGGTVRTTTRKHKKASFCSCVQPPTSS